jgi:peptidoglycan/xylan/chitin deacetylase (PgdA/CDA1 family)
VAHVTQRYGNDSEDHRDVQGEDPEKRRDVRNRIRRAINWLDAWTVEAFNPVYPGRPQS